MAEKLAATWSRTLFTAAPLGALAGSLLGEFVSYLVSRGDVPAGNCIAAIFFATAGGIIGLHEVHRSRWCTSCAVFCIVGVFVPHFYLHMTEFRIACAIDDLTRLVSIVLPLAIYILTLGLAVRWKENRGGHCSAGLISP